MINKTIKLTVLIFASAVFLMLSASGAGRELFWLTSTVTGDTIGPIEKKPGTSFLANGKEWVILSEKPGQILFYDSDTSKQHGPFVFVLNRIVDLGGFAMGISRIEVVNERGDILFSPDRERMSTQPRPVAPDVKRPQRWEPEPLPGTNPAEHKVFLGDLVVELRQYATSGILWFEPVHSVKYDWKVGDYSGSGGEEIDMKRLGLMASWRNWFLELYAIIDGETGGGIVPDKSYLSELRLNSGSGFGGHAGYLYSLVIDGNWNANIGFAMSYEMADLDLDAVVFRESGRYTVKDEDIEGEDADGLSESISVKEYELANVSKGVDMAEFVASLIGGIDYTSDFWGAGIYLLVDVYSDVDFKGSLEVGDQAHKLRADRTHPVCVTLSGWYSPLDSYFISTRASFGTETTFRIGLGKFF
jgi:hypothetical protein